MRRPTVVLAHYAGLDLFAPVDLDRLSETVDILDRAAIGAWDDPRADDLLGEAEVLLGHWGCPRLDEALLAWASRLGLVAYAAGTVKEVVTDAVFARGIRVTSGAPANAEPVAPGPTGPPRGHRGDAQPPCVKRAIAARVPHAGEPYGARHPGLTCALDSTDAA